MIKHYISIARPGHWFKNIFIIPGIVIAYLFVPIPASVLVIAALIGTVSVCLIASANYTINEWLDADFDKHHPLKKDRSSVQGHVKFSLVVVQYVILAAFGLILAWHVSLPFFYTSVWLLIMGLLYNVRPFRTKDKPYLDVLSESINNPIRLLLGWFMVTATVLPPSSLLISYWMAGAFLMAVKRYAEYRLINDAKIAILYRRSFASYNENNLLVSILFYAMTFAFFFGIFMIKYRIELLVSLPFFAILFAWYLRIGMMPDSSAQRPEKLYKERGFMAYVALVIILVICLFLIDWPALNVLLVNAFNAS